MGSLNTGVAKPVNPGSGSPAPSPSPGPSPSPSPSPAPPPAAQGALWIDCGPATTVVAAGQERGATWALTPYKLVSVVAYLAKASDAGPVRIDLTVNGASILSTPLVIPAGQTNSRASTAVFIATSVPQDEEISVDVLAAGQNAAGLTLSITAIDASGGTAAPVATVSPSISGVNPIVGAVYSALSGSWLGGAASGYQWLRDGLPIVGATQQAYALVNGDIHKKITVQVTGTNARGSSTAIAVPVYVIDVPLNVVAPSITGVPFLGQLLTANVGTWIDSPTVYTYEWRRGATVVGTASTYTVVAEDVDQAITVRVSASNAAGTGLATSSAVYPEGPAYGGDELSELSADPYVAVSQLTLAGASYVDPTYALTVTKATNYKREAVGSRWIRHASARQPVFNAGATRYLAKSSDGRWFVYDFGTHKPERALSMPADVEPIWHPTDPDVLWHTSPYGGLVWWARDVTDDSTTVLVDFTGRLGALTGAARVWLRGGCPSADGRYFAFSVETGALVHAGVITWDRNTDTITGTLTAATHGGGTPQWVSMSPTGTYAVVGWAGANGTRSYNRALSAYTAIATGAPTGDLVYGSAGQDLFCYQDTTAKSVRVADCSTGGTYTLMSLLWGAGASQETTDVSISGKAYNRPGWVFLAGYGHRYVDPTYAGTLSTPRPPTRKVFVARLAAGGAAFNVVHTQETEDYGGEVGIPDAVPSRNGRHVIFASNFGREGDVDLFTTELPDVLLPGEPEAPSFAGTPTITAPSGIYEVGQDLQVNIGSIGGEPFPTISYQWRLDGDDIGPDADTITTEDAGDYDCVVTLTNTEGTAEETAEAVTVTSPDVASATRVLSAHNLSDSNYTSAATPAFAVAAGQMIVVAGAYEDYPDGIVSSISDTAGNTYVALAPVVCPDKECRTRVWYCLASAAHAANVVTLSTPGVAIPPTQVRATVYSAGAGNHFEFDQELHAAAGFSYGDLSTVAFDTPGEGVIYAAFSNNYPAATPWPEPVPAGWSYIDNVALPLVSMDMLTMDAMTGVVATMPVGANYSRGSLQAVSFLVVPD